MEEDIKRDVSGSSLSTVSIIVAETLTVEFKTSLLVIVNLLVCV